MTLADQYHLQQNLRLVQTGHKTRAAGIRKCSDCTQAYIDDHTGLRWCPDCRVGQLLRCRQCGTGFPAERAGFRLCPCCREQIALFGKD